MHEDELSELTKDELYEQAQELDIEGRSTMDKEELVEALAEHEHEEEAHESHESPAESEHRILTVAEEYEQQHARRRAAEAKIEEATNPGTPF